MTGTAEPPTRSRVPATSPRSCVRSAVTPSVALPPSLARTFASASPNRYGKFCWSHVGSAPSISDSRTASKPLTRPGTSGPDTRIPLWKVASDADASSRSVGPGRDVTSTTDPFRPP